MVKQKLGCYNFTTFKSLGAKRHFRRRRPQTRRRRVAGVATAPRTQQTTPDLLNSIPGTRIWSRISKQIINQARKLDQN